MRTAAAQHDGFGQAFCAAEFGLEVFVIGIKSRHVLVHRFGFVELPFALKIQCQPVQIAHHLLAQRNPAKAVKRRVKLALALQRKPHHSAGFSGFFVGLDFARFSGQEAFGR